MLDFIRHRLERDEEFQVLVEVEEDGTVVATSPALPGYVAYGPSQASAVRKLRRAIRRNLEGFAKDYVTASREVGDRTSRHKSHLHFHLPLTMTAKFVLGGLAVASALAVVSYGLRRRD